MVKIEELMQEGKIQKMSELERDRYLNFFEQSYTENVKLSFHIIETYPRWSIIAGYYAMHDISKLFLAKKFGLKVEFEVHRTTILVLKAVSKDKELCSLFEKGYKEFILLANDLAEAKGERVKAQYYTGTVFMHEEYKKRALEFYKDIVQIYLERVKRLLP